MDLSDGQVRAAFFYSSSTPTRLREPWKMTGNTRMEAELGSAAGDTLSRGRVATAGGGGSQGKADRKPLRTRRTASSELSRLRWGWERRVSYHRKLSTFVSPDCSYKKERKEEEQALGHRQALARSSCMSCRT